MRREKRAVPTLPEIRIFRGQNGDKRGQMGTIAPNRCSTKQSFLSMHRKKYRFSFVPVFHRTYVRFCRFLSNGCSLVIANFQTFVRFCAKVGERPQNHAKNGVKVGDLPHFRFLPPSKKTRNERKTGKSSTRFSRCIGKINCQII